MKLKQQCWSCEIFFVLLLICELKSSFQDFVQNHAILMNANIDPGDPILNSTASLTTKSRIECLLECTVKSACTSFVYSDAMQICAILSESGHDTFGVTSGWQFYVVKGCEDGWLEYEDSCYFVSDQGNLDWQEAEEYCRLNDSKIIEFESAGEYAFIKLHLTAIHGYWAGGRYDSGSRNWIWFTSRNIIPITSGSTFHAWDPTQPDSSGSQGCIMMLHEFQYFWDDYYCNRKGDFICERSKV